VIKESTANAIAEKALELGFVRCGIAPTDELPHRAELLEWIKRAKHAAMSYMEREAPNRADPKHLLPSAQSAIVVAARYWHPNDQDLQEEQHQNATQSYDTHTVPEPTITAKIARYARGKDYHIVLRERLEELISWIKDTICTEFDYRLCVDSSPLLERELAKAAGIGFFGKNTLLISPGIGSYTVLGVALTSLPLTTITKEEQLSERCGRCTICIDQCPTQAIEKPYVLNAEKCISYHTIENNGHVPSDIVAKLSDWAFGCDICQEVCPFNTPTTKSKLINPDPDLSPQFESTTTNYLLQLGSGEHKRFTKDRALRRNSKAAFVKNAANILRANVQNLSREKAALAKSQLQAARPGQDLHAADAISSALVDIRRKQREMGEN